VDAAPSGPEPEGIRQKLVPVSVYFLLFDIGKKIRPKFFRRFAAIFPSSPQIAKISYASLRAE